MHREKEWSSQKKKQKPRPVRIVKDSFEHGEIRNTAEERSETVKGGRRRLKPQGKKKEKLRGRKGTRIKSGASPRS